MEREEFLLKMQEIISKEKAEIFKAYHALILEYNEKYNLTTILEETEVFYKHFLDSVAGADLFKPNSKVAEIGSGAGFPSIPLKIVRPDLSFDLFESVGKKCEFLNVVIEKLSLAGVRVYNKRAEDCAKDSAFREKYDHATARAVARMNTLTEYCLPFVKVGGSFIAYKSGNTEEIDEAISAYKTLGGVLEKSFKYALPNEFGERSLAVVKKIKPTPNRYPRGQGKERKNPL